MTSIHKLSLFIIAVLLLCPSSTYGQPLETDIVATNLDTPWEILWGPDNQIWMTERYGRVSKLNPVTNNVKPLLTIPGVHEQGESGLLGMTLHPAFMDTPSVFMAYNYLDGGSIKERIVKYRYQADTLVQPDTLLENIQGNDNHDGCRMVITEDRKLLFSTGDARNASAAQNDNSLSGKFLRMNLDGTIPHDNPMANSYMFSKGHRNPQGLVIGPDGTIYSSEHGPQTDDELNIIRKGRNYGWPDVKGFCNTPSEQTFCNNNNVVEPLIAWTPTLAVCGLHYYDKTAIPGWDNSLLMVSLKEAELRQMPLNTSGDSILAQNVYFDDQYGRLRDIAISPSGDVYLATSNRDGRGDPVPEDDRIIRVSLPTGFTNRHLTNNKQFNLYPNPAKNYLHLSFDKNANPLSIKWINLKGKIVESSSINSLNQSFTKKNFESGVYLLQIEGKGWQEVRKVVWQ